MTVSAEHRFSTSAGYWRLWAGLLLGPLGWALHLSFSYGLVTLMCRTGWAFLLPVISLLSLAIAGLGGYIAWTNWNEAGREWPSGEGGILHRGRFMAFCGLIFSAMFALVIIAQWIPGFALDPCRGV